MLKGKTVLLGVTGGIACYKSAGLASALVKQGANVQVLMTRNATEFIGPHTFESLTGNRVSVDTFDRNYQFQVEHIALADQADLVLVAPATANVLAKLAHGLADDMLTTTVLACDCPKIAAPAMNTRMYENPVTQDNLALLRRYGWEIVEPASGRLACGAVGEGEDAGAGGAAGDGASRPLPCQGHGGTEGAGHRRPHPGGTGSGALPDQPLHRADGLRRGPGRRRPRGGGDAGVRPHGS